MIQNTKTIFISYGRDEKNPQDVELVRKVKRDLEAEGFEVLMDEEQLRTSQDWEIELESMIRKSDWILFFITPYSARRPEGYCLNELAMSLAYKVPIAPVMVSYEVPPLSICRVQYLDLQTLKGDEDYAKKLKEIVSVINDEKRLGFEGGHLKLLNELNPIKFETTIAKHIHGFTGREWVYNEVDRWLEEEENSRVLWIMAEAGFGKSAISTYLSKSHPSALGIHFCQYDLSESQEAREMLKVLIYQLSTQIEEYHKILQTLDVKELPQKSPEYIFTQLLLEPLQQIGKQEKKHFFVIDALDEAKADGKNEIVELIANRFLDLPSWLNIVITSRPEPELLRKLKKFNPIELKADDKRNKSDLELLLSKPEKILPEKVLKKSELLKKIKLTLSDKNIVQKLIQKSEGNILYLKSIFELDMIKEGDLTLESIEKLPDSMEGFYLTYFERKFEDKKLYKEECLEFVGLLVEEEGMPELLLRDILGLREREYQEIKSSFGSLLEVHDINLTFYHKSIYEWLSNYDKSGSYSADVELGREKFEDFMDGLTDKNYKKEYFKFTFFNRLLMYRIFLQNEDIDKFYKMIESVDNEEKTNFLIILGSTIFHLARLRRANTFWSNIKYTKDAGSWQWVEDYISELECDQNSNFQHDDISFLEKSVIVLGELYKENPNQWVDDYITELGHLKLSYEINNNFLEALALEKKLLSVLETMQDKYSENWEEDYSESVKNIAMYYIENNMPKEAITLLEKNLTRLKKVYMQNTDAWAVGYTRICSFLATSYRESNKIKEAIELDKEIVSVFEEQHENEIKKFMDDEYAIALNNLATSYCRDFKFYKAIDPIEKSAKIYKGLYEKDKNKWEESYLFVYDNLISLCKQESNKRKIKQLKREHKNISNLYDSTKSKPKTIKERTGRNEPCFCGSGKKYKKCCGSVINSVSIPLNILDISN